MAPGKAATIRRTAPALATALAILAATGAQAPAPSALEKLSWYGDPKAPNLSGV